MSTHTAKRQKTGEGNISVSKKGLGNAEAQLKSALFALGQPNPNPNPKKRSYKKIPRVVTQVAAALQAVQAAQQQHGGKKTRKAKSRKMRKRMTRRRR